MASQNQRQSGSPVSHTASIAVLSRTCWRGGTPTSKHSLRRKEKACGLDSLDHMNWVKFSLEDSSGISKHCPEQNSPAPVPAVLTNCNTIGTWLCLSEIFESSSFWECYFLSLKCVSAVRSKPRGGKLRAVAEALLGQRCPEAALHVWEQIF